MSHVKDITQYTTIKIHTSKQSMFQQVGRFWSIFQADTEVSNRLSGIGGLSIAVSIYM